MTDAQAIAAGHRAIVASGAGNVTLARYIGSAEISWRRHDALGDHVELAWRPARDQLAHVLVTQSTGSPEAFPITSAWAPAPGAEPW